MAKFDNLTDPIWTGNQDLDSTTEWNGHTG